MNEGGNTCFSLSENENLLYVFARVGLVREAIFFQRDLMGRLPISDSSNSHQLITLGHFHNVSSSALLPLYHLSSSRQTE
jgi:hypothetical protein